MDYLVQFYQDLLSDKMVIREKYLDHNREKNDVVTDLNDYNKPSSVACLPIARQITVFEKKICLQLPKLGDIFIGLLDHKVIESVKFIINNYSEEILIEGKLQTVGQQKLWQFTELPVILLNITDYHHVNIEVQILLNNSYNLHTYNQEVFKAYYGFFHQPIQNLLLKQTIIRIPLLASNDYLETVCGMWTVT